MHVFRTTCGVALELGTPAAALEFYRGFCNQTAFFEPAQGGFLAYHRGWPVDYTSDASSASGIVIAVSVTARRHEGTFVAPAAGGGWERAGVV